MPRRTWRDREHGFREDKRHGLRWLCTKPCAACAAKWRASKRPLCTAKEGCIYWPQHPGPCETVEEAMAYAR